MSKKKAFPFTLTITVVGTDGEKQTKTVEVPKPCPIKDILEFHGYAYDKHDLLLGGKLVTPSTVVGEQATLALKKQKEPPAPKLEVRERPSGS